MGIKSISLAISVLVLSANVNAAVISVDWQSTGDNLMTRDTNSGLDWLDLTETNSMSYDTVSAQLGTGGQFEGWRYATSAEVVTLWSNFGVHLNQFYSGSGPFDPSIDDAARLLGNIWFEARRSGSGLLGLTATTSSSGNRAWMGAYNSTSAVYYTDGSHWTSDYGSSVQTGSFLVQTSPVPVPAAVWLFGFGLIGLIGVARRKKA